MHRTTIDGFYDKSGIFDPPPQLPTLAEVAVLHHVERLPNRIDYSKAEK